MTRQLSTPLSAQENGFASEGTPKAKFRTQHPRTTRPRPCALREARHKVLNRAMSEISRAPAHVSEVDARACLLPTTAPVPARETSSPDVDLRDEAAPLLTRDAAPGRRSEKSGPMAILRSISASSMVFVGGAVASLAAVIFMGYSPFETSGARDQLGVEPIARALQHQVVVAFQSAGFVNYHATVRLFRAAFPDKDIILVDAGDANADVDNRHAFARSSADGLPVDLRRRGSQRASLARRRERVPMDRRPHCRRGMAPDGQRASVRVRGPPVVPAREGADGSSRHDDDQHASV